jgi:glutathione-independent formaldehyde dehydrogenase
MVPYADFNALVIDAPRRVIMDKIASIALLADILPTGYHGAVSAGVTTGGTVYVAGAGPVGLACATSCQILGASVVIVGDLNEQRLAAARAFGCKTVNLSNESQTLEQQLAAILGRAEVDCAIDCVGFEARGCGGREEQPAVVLNQLMEVTKAAGQVSLVGLYVTDDPGSQDKNAQVGSLSLRIGLGWAKSLTFVTGQCPVKRYNRKLLNMILHSDIDFAKRVNAVVVPLEQAVAAYKDFDGGAAKKYILDCNGLIAAHHKNPKL